MSLEERIEEILELSDDELVEELPSLIDDLEGRTDEIVDEQPVEVSRLMNRLDRSNISGLYSDADEIADRFQDFLWNIIQRVVEKNDDLKDEITMDAKVSFEASDSDMKGHLIVDKSNEKIRGGSGSINDAELYINGPTDVLTGMLTGSTDPVQSFMAGEFEMDGSVDKGMQLASIMTPINEKLRNEE